MSWTSKRRQLFIDPTFQARFIVKFCVIVVVSSLLIAGVVLALTSSSTTIAIENSKVLVKPTSDYILPVLSLTVLTVTAGAALAVLMLTLFISHRIAGPVYRIQTEVERMKDGDLVRNFNIREKDELQGLAHGLSLTVNSLRSHHLELKNACQSLLFFLEERDFVVTPQDKDEVRSRSEQVRSALDYFKV